MQEPGKRNGVFVSYNQADKKWLDLLLTHLQPQICEEGLQVFVGEQMAWGVRWRKEIERALHSARVAVLIISKDFLASEFITLEELPPLLDAAKKGETTILPLLAEPSSWPERLSQYRAVNPPSRTLAEMSKAQRNRLMVKLANRISALMKEADRTQPAQTPPEAAAATTADPAIAPSRQRRPRNAAQRRQRPSVASFVTLALGCGVLISILAIFPRSPVTLSCTVLGSALFAGALLFEDQLSRMARVGLALVGTLVFLVLAFSMYASIARKEWLPPWW